MPLQTGSPKRQRQYKHIKESLLERGAGMKKAKEIAARRSPRPRWREA
jgi:hypothetical protein